MSIRGFASRRSGLLTAAAVLLVVAAAFVAGPLRRSWAARTLATGRAQWIWCEGRAQAPVGPLSCYAVRDFELTAPAAPARLLIQADEEYVAYLNGQLVGANRCGPGAPLDVYDVSGLLRAGGNRLLVELRSGRGAGGLLASMDIPGLGRALIPTGSEWRLYRQNVLGLFAGWLDSGPAEPMWSWGMPPLGRWGQPRPGPVRPAADSLPSPAALPTRARALLPARAWQELSPGSDLASEPEATGGLILLDWGREVSGYLTLEMRGPGGGEALLFWAASPPDPRRRAADLVVVSPPGAYVWRAPVARSFRYVLLAGLTDVAAARVILAPPGAAEGSRRGVFGLDPPPLRTPAEDELRRKLKGFAGVAFGEEG